MRNHGLRLDASVGIGELCGLRGALATVPPLGAWDGTGNVCDAVFLSGWGQVCVCVCVEHYMA